jgi:phosphoglycerate dehydrogenase-like enzyme
MKRYKILITRSLLDTDIEYIKKGLDLHVSGQFEIIIPDSFDEEGICSVIRDADILLGPFVTRRMLMLAENLKLIQIPWTGMDTFNFDAIKGLSIPVCNSHSNADAVAEFAVALVLDLVKKISYHDRKMRQGDWNRGQKPLDLSSLMLSKQTVCILGYGNIGRRIGKLMNAFGSKILATTNNTTVSDGISKLYNSNDWIEAVSASDIIINTMPLTSRTKGQINADAIKKMKRGSLLVNVSRAEIIDEDAVFEALISGHIRGFASDVWWRAPSRGATVGYASNHNRFEELENVILSPHRAGFIENTIPHLDDVIVNISNLIKGLPLINVVDINVEY